MPRDGLVLEERPGETGALQEVAVQQDLLLYMAVQNLPGKQMNFMQLHTEPKNYIFY